MIEKTLSNMANSLLINYCGKEEALIFARNEIDRALKSISNVFKEFHDDYLFLLGDHKRMQSILNNFVTNESNDDFSNNKQNDNRKAAFMHENDIVKDPETPGIVENTQLEQPHQLKNKIHKKKPISQSSPKKNTHNNENKMSKLNISKFSPSKSQTKKMSLSRSSAEIRVLSSGKISRQCKLVAEPVKIKAPFVKPPSLEGNNKNEINGEAGQLDDFNIDETMFEVPFSQENTPKFLKTKNNSSWVVCDEIVERSPKKPAKVSKTKSSSGLSLIIAKSSKNSINAAVNDEVKSTTNVSQSLVGRTSRKTDKKSSSGSIKLFSSAKQAVDPADSPILVNESQFYSLSDGEEMKSKDNAIECDKNKGSSQDTLFPVDETYCQTGEIMLANNNTVNNTQNTINGGKRRASVTAGPSKADLTSQELALEVGNISDWDTDMSCDKWSATPPKKRNLLDSFDRIPEKKKISPKYAFKGPVVRNKAERAKLPGWDCSNCEKYYQLMDLSEGELQERKNKCSRHRSKFNERYFTPPGFWDPQFPDTISSDDEKQK